MKGMNLEAMRQMARNLGAESEALEKSADMINRLLHELDWVGVDATSFSGQWEGGLHAKVRDLLLAMRDLNIRLANDIEQQERASSADGGGSESPSSPGGVAPPMPPRAAGEPEHDHKTPTADPYRKNRDEWTPEHADTSESDPRHADTSESDPRHADDDPSKPRHADVSESDPRHADTSESDPRHADDDPSKPRHADTSESDPRHADDDPHNPRRADDTPTSEQAGHDWNAGKSGVKTFGDDAPKHLAPDETEDRSKSPDTFGGPDYAEKGLSDENDVSLDDVKNPEMKLAEAEGDISMYKETVKSGPIDLPAGMTASGEASLVVGGVAGAASVALSKDGLSASASAEATVVKAEAKGSVGNEHASLTGVASAEVGVKTGAEANLGPDGVKAGANYNAFAGVQASATGQVDVAGVKPSVTGHVYAGIGAHGNADVELSASHVKASVDVGLAVGVGAGLSFDVDVDVNEIGENLKNAFHF